MRICIDMDEVIVDNYHRYHTLYEEKFGEPIDKEKYWGKRIYDLPGIESIRDHLHDPGFFRDLPAMDNAVEVVRELYEKHEVYIVTAAMEFRNSFLDKYEWLEEHLPFVHWQRIVFCGDKSIVHGDYMIDDKVKNLDGFNGRGILFTASHNVHDEGDFIRMNNWLQIRDYFRDRRRAAIARHA